MAKREANGKPNKGGRPVKEIDFTTLDKLCELQCLQEEIAHFFEVSISTLERRVKEKTGGSFDDYYSQKRGQGKIALRRKQMQVALKGNVTMLIWLGKQALGQKDKQELEHTGKDGGPIQVAFDKAFEHV